MTYFQGLRPSFVRDSEFPEDQGSSATKNKTNFNFNQMTARHCVHAWIQQTKLGFSSKFEHDHNSFWETETRLRVSCSMPKNVSDLHKNQATFTTCVAYA